MRGAGSSRWVVALVVALLAFYFVLLGSRAVSLFGDPRLVVQGLGLGVLLLPLIGVAIVVQELRFGRAAERLGRRWEQEDQPPDVTFDRCRARVQASPDDWRAWYLLGVAYGDAGDVGRGRRAVRRAIALESGSVSASARRK